MKQIFLVLGMHRGGTSAIARGLLALGVSLGDTLLPPKADNPAGFWEDREILALNERVLAALGLGWDSLIPISDHSYCCPELAAIGADAKALLSARLGASPRWGFKDPRTSRLLRFWEPILQELQFATGVVIAVRNPLSVAASLAQRNAFRPERSHLLWLLHMMPLLRLETAPRSVVVDYDRLLDSPDRELSRMADRLGLAAPSPAAITAYRDTFLDRRLRHSRFTAADLAADARATPVAVHAYNALHRLARDRPVEPAEIERLADEFGGLAPLLSYAHVLEGAVAAQAGRITCLENNASDRGDVLGRRAAELNTLLAERRDHRIAMEEKESRIESLQAERADLRTAVAKLRADVARLEQTTAYLRNAADESAGRLAAIQEIDDRIAGLERALEQQHASAVKMTDGIGRLERDVTALRAQAAVNNPEVLSPLTRRRAAPSRLALRAARFRGLAARLLSALCRHGPYRTLRIAAARIGQRLAGSRSAKVSDTRLPAPQADQHNSPTDIARIRTSGPVVTILTPVFNTPPEILDEAIQSVLQQTYPNWELCICDDGSSDESTLDVLEHYRGADWRIKITRSPENLHIARATNLAAEMATGEFVAFLDHDDVLEIDALECVAAAIESDPQIDFLYTDEDKLEPDGRLTEPYLKPDWSPEHLLSVMYVLHFMVVRKKLFLALGGLRHEFTGSQDYDLALRATAKARRVAHVPRVLYHWRKVPNSAAARVDAKPDALRNAKRALQAFVRQQDPGARVKDGLLPGTYRVCWSLQPAEPVTLLVLTGARSRNVEGRGNLLLVENFIDSIISKSTYPSYRLLVVDDNANLPRSVRRKVEAAGGSTISFPLTPPFNFAEKMNFALAQVETEDVILLNDDLEVISEDWIEAMLAFSRRPGIGAVGAMLLFPTGRVQHAGVVMGVGGPAAHIFHNAPADSVGYYGYSHLIRNYSAVTAAAMATRMSLVRKVGNFDEALAVDFNDIDFCLRLRSAGYRIVYTPHARLYHFEGSSIPRRSQCAAERSAFHERWRSQIGRDPYYHPLLPRDRLDCMPGAY